MAKVATLRRLAKTFRIAPTRDSVLVHLARDTRIGWYTADICNVTTSNLIYLLGLMGSDVFADFGLSDGNQWWRLHYKRQHWCAVPHRMCHFGLVVTDDPSRVACKYDSLWTLRYGLKPLPSSDEGHVHLPYQMSPSQLRAGAGDLPLEDLRSARRPIRILFAGRTIRKLYDRVHYLGERFGKETRWRVLDHLRGAGRVIEVSSQADLERLIADGCSEGVVVIDSARVVVTPEKWLGLLASADFFLCPPGEIMPLCHNLIESMAVGTIPLTNYPDWLSPPLVDGREALVFDTLSSLDTAIARALAMGGDEIRRIRMAVSDYYDQHLDCRRVAERLSARRHESLQLTITDEVMHRVEALPKLFPSQSP